MRQVLESAKLSLEKKVLTKLGFTMEKRGQFYIIAAVIIIIIISGIATLETYAIAKPTPKTIDTLSSDLQTEGSRIVDYGIYSKEDVNKVLANFTQNDFAPYFLKVTGNSTVIFIYGNNTNVYATRYKISSKGTISANIGGSSTSSSSWSSSGTYAENLSIQTSPGDNYINVTLLGKTFPFQLKNNQVFYFVMAQDSEGDINVKKSE